MTKQQILLKMDEVDSQILEMTENKDQIDWRKIKKLKKADLECLLDAFETMYEMFSRMMAESEEL